MVQNKIKILLTGWFFYPKTGGAETIILSHAKWLVRQGYDVTVVTSVLDKENITERDSYLGINIIRKKYIDAKTQFTNQQLTEIGDDFFSLLEEIKPDIIHCHNWSYPSGGGDKREGAKLVVSLVSKIRETDAILIEHAHNAQLKQPEATKVLRDLNWDCLVCVSNFVKDHWLKLGTAAKDIRVVYNGIDLEKFRTAKVNPSITELKNDNKKLIFFPTRILSLTTGEINPQKNIMLVLKACNLLLRKGIENFKIIAVFDESVSGDLYKERAAEFKKIVKKLNLTDNVIFIPSIDPEIMPSYYAGIDILCVPSYNETFGMVYLEAMAAGKIAIAGNSGGPKDYISNGKNGFLVNMDNDKELANTLENLLTGKINILQIQEEAKRTASNFSSNDMGANIEKIYDDLLQEKNNRILAK